MNLSMDIVDKILALQEQSLEGKIIVVGIGGPLASGKSTLANEVEAKFLQLGKPVLGFKMDWVLKDRNLREADLRLIISKTGRKFYEPYHHMKLNRVHRFLEKVHYYNEQLSTNSRLVKGKTLLLKKLYNRINGSSNECKEIHLEPNLIILLDGQYNLLRYLDYYVDFQYLLLVDIDILLQRLYVRSQGYRVPALTKEYFLRVNLPSLIRYLTVCLQNADVIIDNNDWNQPKIMHQNEAYNWIDKAQQQWGL